MRPPVRGGACGARETTLHELRPWWQPPYVVYGFANPRIRSLLERLVSTYVVRATDRNFMIWLQQRTREDHEEQVRRRIFKREVAEVEREKRLILEGKMPMEEAPEELANHPVFKMTQLANKILAEIRLAEKKKKPERLKTFDYSLLDGLEPEDEEDTEMRSCIEEEENNQPSQQERLQETELMLDGSNAVTDEDYLRIKYEDPMVSELMETEVLDDLCEIADEVVGPLIGKKCGGMIK